MLLWPTNAAGFTLQHSTNLASTNWTTVVPPPGIVNGERPVYCHECQLRFGDVFPAVKVSPEEDPIQGLLVTLDVYQVQRGVSAERCKERLSR